MLTDGFHNDRLKIDRSVSHHGFCAAFYPVEDPSDCGVSGLTPKYNDDPGISVLTPKQSDDSGNRMGVTFSTFEYMDDSGKDSGLSVLTFDSMDNAGNVVDVGGCSFKYSDDLGEAVGVSVLILEYRGGCHFCVLWTVCLWMVLLYVCRPPLPEGP